MAAQALPRQPGAIKKVARGSSVDLDSIVSSEFEEVRLEDVEHSGSGEEVEWAPSMADNEAASQPPKQGPAAAAAPPAADSAFSTPGKTPGAAAGVVGKTASAPRPPLARGPVVPTASPNPTPGRSPGLAAPASGTGAAAAGKAAAPAAARAAEETSEANWRGRSRSQESANDAGIYGEPMYDPLLKEIETATHKAAELARDAAKDAATKLLDGAAEAKQSLTRLATDVSSWWANLDPVPKTPNAPNTPKSQAASAPESKAMAELAGLFGLAQGEEALESFACTLVQTYACQHNALSPPREVAFAGKLYVTGQHACFHAPAEKVAFALAHDDMRSVAKLPAPRGVSPGALWEALSTGAGSALRLEVGEAQWVVLRLAPRDADPALALLEHLTTST